MRKDRGFTLIELIVVVALISIMTAIALPSYRQHVVKGKQGAAKAFLLQVASREAQYLIDNRTGFANATSTEEIRAALGVSPPSEIAALYQFSVVTFSKGTGGASPPGFRVVAAPLVTAELAGTNCLSLSDEGVKLKGTGTACSDNTATESW